MEAEIYYTGSLQSLNHKAPSGNRYVFVGPNVPTKVNDEKDIIFYSKKASFKVTILKEEGENEPIQKPEEKPEREEQVSEPEETARKPKEKREVMWSARRTW